MKSIKKLIYLMLAVFIVSVSCPNVIPFVNSHTKVEAAVKLSKKTAVILKGKTVTLKVKGTKKKAKWSTSNKSVATVNSKGKVSGKKAGIATITANIGGKKYSCKVTIESPSISIKKASVYVGSTVTLKMNGTTQKIKWKSSKKSVATVNSKGVVAGKKKGTATITATVFGKKYTCKVTVNNKPKKPVKKFNSSDAYKNIERKIYTVGGEVVCLLKSNYDFPTSITADCYFYDKNGNPVETSYAYCFWLEKGREGLLSFREPDVEYYNFEIRYDMFQSAAYIGNESVVRKVNVTSNLVNGEYSDKLFLKVQNNYSKKLNSVDIIIKYYDKFNKLVAIRNIDVYDIPANSYVIEEEYGPFDYNTFADIEFSRYEVSVSTATYH